MRPREEAGATVNRLRLDNTATLRDYVRILARHKWVIALSVVLVPTAAVLLTLRQTPLYEASAEVLLSRQNLVATLTGTEDPQAFQQAERVAETQAQLAQVPDVASRTLEAVAGADMTVDEFQSASGVEARRGADLLTFTVTHEIPRLAEALASEYARQFTQYRLELDTRALALARKEVETRLAELDAIGDTTSTLATSLADKAQQLRTMEALQTSNAFVVRSAGLATQVRPLPVRNGLLAAVLGIVLGIVLAFVWEALDTRVRSAEEIGARLGLPLLARLPGPGRRLRNKHSLVMLADPGGTDAESVRILRTNLEFANLERDARTIMITSAVEGEGKSTTIANLAIAYARAGQRVALVDLDLRRPFVGVFFGLENRPGVTDVALGRIELDRALVPVEISRPGGGENGRAVLGELEVLPSGPLPPDAGEFVGTRALGAILRSLRDRFDLVFVDAPPMLKIGDPLTLSGRVDALVVVSRLKIVRRGMLAELSRVLATSPAAKLGFVVTDAGAEDGYGHSYGYGYGYGYAQNGSSGYAQNGSNGDGQASSALGPVSAS
jgi:succinoglycan biosynthesis transport protein ExoP